MTKRALIKEYSVEIERLKDELNAAREKNGVFMPYEKFQRMELMMAGQSSQLGELEDVLGKKSVQWWSGGWVEGFRLGC